MAKDWHATVEQALIGISGSVERRDFDWVVHLEGGGLVTLPIPWRIVANGQIAFADRDDGHQFGLPTPVDGQEVTNALLRNKVITGVSIDRETADLSIAFGTTTRLDAFNHSSGYEGWHINLPAEKGGIWAIAMGGGELSIF